MSDRVPTRALFSERKKLRGEKKKNTKWHPFLHSPSASTLPRGHRAEEEVSDAELVGEPLSRHDLMLLCPPTPPSMVFMYLREEAHFPLSTLLPAPGGIELCDEPQALMPPVWSKILCSHYLGADVRGGPQCAGAEPLVWRQACQNPKENRAGPYPTDSIHGLLLLALSKQVDRGGGTFCAKESGFCLRALLGVMVAAPGAAA